MTEFIKKLWESKFEESEPEVVNGIRKDYWYCSLCGWMNIVVNEDYGKIHLCENCGKAHEVIKPEE